MLVPDMAEDSQEVSDLIRVQDEEKCALVKEMMKARILTPLISMMRKCRELFEQGQMEDSAEMIDLFFFLF